MTTDRRHPTGTTETAAGRRAKPRSLGSRPEFQLVYLLFYFVPWLFVTPSPSDIFVAILAIALFLPLHFSGFEKSTPKYIWHVILIQTLTIATAPFNGMQGVFHIYASVQAAFQRPARSGAMLMLGLAISYLLLSILTEARWGETIFVLLMAALTGIHCMSGAEQIERQQALERSRALDRQLAAIAERERIARDLHDLLGHTLTMVALKAEVADRLFDSDPQRSRLEIGEIREASRMALKDVRDVVTGMNETTIEAEINRASKALAAAGVSFTVHGEPPAATAQQSKTIGLAIREAVTNIVRHAAADQATLTFGAEPNGFRVTIQDNGQGGDFLPGSGLTGLRQRIERLGGQATIEMRSGARIVLQMPYTNGTGPVARSAM